MRPVVGDRLKVELTTTLKATTATKCECEIESSSEKAAIVMEAGPKTVKIVNLLLFHTSKIFRLSLLDKGANCVRSNSIVFQKL